MDLSQLLARRPGQIVTVRPVAGQVSAEECEKAINNLPPHLKEKFQQTPLIRRIAAYRTVHEPTQSLLRLTNLIAQRREPVLIEGESGTGKEILARIMLNQRPDTDYYPANCAGIPEQLFESLMFGHLKGSFTGAVEDRKGLLATAGTGIVFLDEIGELPMLQQAKLLRAIQDHKIQPVGSPHSIPIQCRFVFATNRNLADRVAEGAFREDLYYRISALHLRTYPLRERPDDALLIALAICEERGYEHLPTVIPDHIIQSRGNVRALENWLLQRQVYDLGRDGINPNIGDNTK